MRKINTLLLMGMLCPLLSFSQTRLPIALEYLAQNKNQFKLTFQDISDVFVTHEFESHTSDIVHIYLRQKLQGIEVINSNMSLHFDADDQVIYTANRFIPNLEKHLESNIISFEAKSAVINFANWMGYFPEESPELIQEADGTNQKIVFRWSSISSEDIPVKLVFQRLDNGKIRLAWDIVLFDLHQGINGRIDAADGRILDVDQWTVNCKWDNEEMKIKRETHLLEWTNPGFLNLGNYKVLPMPIESPNHGTREMISDPSDAMASPYGWHDHDGIPGAEFTFTKGNNVHAQLDDDANNGTEGFSPDGGLELSFDYNIDFTADPSTYDSAAISNLFYWNNIVHDVLYQYGFDEPAGNFQYNNYGEPGEGGDYVMADAQDASSTNNANFTTPPDGTAPRMQMFLWDTSDPELDGDLDNGIIVHEYGHGVSNRLVGGANNVSCLGNRENMGEGWSDWFALMLTIESNDQGDDTRGIGTYALNEETNGDGIRSYPYSTNMTTNPHTYDDIKTEPVPHGVGSVWCALLWELTWEMIDEYGFDPDFYYGSGGNNKTLQLVIEAMKYMPCSPGFIDARDAIIAADQSIYNGDNFCTIWSAFAKRGLGFSATQGDSDDRGDGIEAFDLPPGCSVSLQISGNSSASPGSNILYQITVENISGSVIEGFVLTNLVPDSTSFVSASDGGSEGNGMISWPEVNLGVNQTMTRTFSVEINEDVDEIVEMIDDVESSNQEWTIYATNPGLSQWIISDSNPNQGINSWFAADQNNHNDQYLTTNKSYIVNSNSELVFWHYYDTEFRWDGGKVQISTDMGNIWTDLGDHMTLNGYNSYIDNNSESPAFSGSGVNYKETKVDLGSYDGQEVMIRFWMHTDGSVGDNGWYIDDINLTNVGLTIADTVKASFEGLEVYATVFPTTQVEESTVPAELINFYGYANENNNLLEWQTASEINVSSFAIEMNLDLEGEWTEVGRVSSKGNSTDLQEYKFEHQYLSPLIYYRLKVLDYDNKSEFSNIIIIRRELETFSDLNLYPNPTEGYTQLSFSSHLDGIVDVKIYDTYGQLVQSKKIEVNKDYNQIPLSLISLEKGLYFVWVEQGDRYKTQKIILH